MGFPPGPVSLVTPVILFPLAPQVASPEAADLQVDFLHGSHGDGYPFDGAGGAVGHAFFPSDLVRAGGVHLDAEEDWAFRQPGRRVDQTTVLLDLNGSGGSGDAFSVSTRGGQPFGLVAHSGFCNNQCKIKQSLPPPLSLTATEGTDLFTVLLHEFGHALGLVHSTSRHSVMRPYYQGPAGDPLHYSLGAQDLEHITTLYGAPSSHRQQTLPSLCCADGTLH